MSATRRLAFYTPLKHPFLPEASGDREIGRTLLDAVRACGYAPELASRMSTWRRAFSPEAAVRLDRLAALRAQTLVRRYRRRAAAARPRLWLTYQNYYRCPDLLGPLVATALEIPYVLVAPAVSRSSRRTEFRPWVSAARLALRRADVIFSMAARDLPALARLRGARFAEQRLRLLPPAVDPARFDAGPEDRARHHRQFAARFAASDGPLCLCVAMMRTADKLDSYRLLAAALARLPRAWRLLVVGDGPARPDVEAALARLPVDRVRLTGALPPDALPALYAGADLFAFPGIGEDYGMVYLEAAAAALPVVACRGSGPEEAVAPGGGILTAPQPEAYAAGLQRVIEAPEERRRLGETARRYVIAERSLEAFRARLRDGLARVELP